MSNFLFEKAKCVFIHIPKTGGASIRHGVFKSEYKGPVFAHIPPDWQKYYKFAFIRNPFDRLVSAWKMFTDGMENTYRIFEIDQSLSLSDFLAIVTDESIAYGERRTTIAEKIRHHTIPQTHPFNCLQEADFIGRFENLQEDWEKVCQDIGIEPISLPRWNVSKHGNYETYYDDKCRKIAEKYYERDLELLGYRFSESHTTIQPVRPILWPHQVLAERHDRIAELSAELGLAQQTLAELNAQIVSLHQVLAERDRKIEEIFASSSWRLTRPLREIKLAFTGLRLANRPVRHRGRGLVYLARQFLFHTRAHGLGAACRRAGSVVAFRIRRFASTLAKCVIP